MPANRDVTKKTKLIPLFQFIVAASTWLIILANESYVFLHAGMKRTRVRTCA